MDEAVKLEMKKEAKRVISEFGLALQKVKGVNPKKFVGESTREEGIVPNNSNFREQMFANAIEKDEDYLYVGKKKW